MKITRKEIAKYVESPEGRNAWIYSFPECEFQYDEQQPHTALKWHRHEKIWEMIYVVEGDVIMRWKEDGEIKEQAAQTGDIIEPGLALHSLENRADKIVKFIAVKFMLSGEDRKEMIEKDKIYDN
jgi:uncharacterized cupin superfamily protein